MPASMPTCRSNSIRRATTTATARTRPPRPAATPTCRPPARRPCSAASAASRRAPASRPTRPAGRYPARPVPAPASTCWRRSTRPSPTASTSSTTRSAARTTNFRDPVEIAFLFAADAGVFVAASAGNSGPTSSTVAHPGPWLTTVAAGTHNRDGNGSTTLGNASPIPAHRWPRPSAPQPLIDSIAAGLPGADPTPGAVLRRR